MSSEPPVPTDDVLSFDILTGMREWRLQHPNAPLREIEEALDARWYHVRARMLEDLALRSSAANWNDTVDRPVCPDCGRPLIRRGRQPRQLKTHGGQALTLNRTYGYCPACKKGHFPGSWPLLVKPVWVMAWRCGSSITARPFFSFDHQKWP